MRQSGELIKRRFYSRSRDWNNLIPKEFLNSWFALFFPFSFFFFCLLSSFPWLGSLDDSPSGLPIEGETLPQLGAPDLRLVLPPAVEAPVLGSASPHGILPEEERTPRDGVLENHQGSSECFPLRMAASTVRGSGSPPSLFPGGHSPVPHQSTSGFPFGRKPQDPWGSSWPRLGPSRGESGPCAKHYEKVENCIPGYQLGYRNPCGFQ